MLPATVFAQDSAKDEIPIERCDRLPVVKVHVGEKDMHFLVDTAGNYVAEFEIVCRRPLEGGPHLFLDRDGGNQRTRSLVA